MDPWFVFERALELRGVDLEEEEAISEEAMLLGLVSNERFLAIPFLPFTPFTENDSPRWFCVHFMCPSHGLRLLL